ncbi:O-antigen polymerase [Nibricoccus sp. IMCC34717]|uniref:O-antigen polymerase n=1 Tax=Nibricoccus sp. IMCC34717 TaxID=3034021 RepID=UPI0038507C40
MKPFSTPSRTTASPFVPLGRGVETGAVVLLILFTLVCVIGALINTPDNEAGPVLALSDAFYMAALIWPLYAYRGDRGGLFHPLVFLTLFTGMLRYLPRMPGKFIFGLSHHAVLPLDQVDLTYLCAYENFLQGLALVCTYIGFHLSRNMRTPPISGAPPKRVALALAVSLAISLAALALMVQSSGSFFGHLRNLTLNREAKVFVDDPGALGLYGVLTRFFATSLCVFFGFEISRNRSRTEKMRFWFIWGGLFVAALALVFLGAGKRSVLLTYAIPFLCIFALHERKIPWMRGFIAAAILLVVFAGVQAMRGTAGSANSMEDIQAAVSEKTGDNLANTYSEMADRLGSYSSSLPIFHFVPSQSPLLWGETYLTILFRPIPRAIWPTKPFGTDFRAGYTFFGAAWGIPPGPVAEAYWNFHIPGVIGVYLLMGVFYQWLAKIYLANHRNGLIAVFYFSTLYMFSPTENVITIWMHGLMALGLFAIITGCIRFRRPSKGQALAPSGAR